MLTDTEAYKWCCCQGICQPKGEFGGCEIKTCPPTSFNKRKQINENENYPMLLLARLVAIVLHP